VPTPDTNHQVELPPEEGDEIHAFWHFAKAYVRHFAADDIFRVEGRVRGSDTRELTWSPGEGPSVLAGYVRDYQEYFEAIWFPPLDAEVFPGGENVRVNAAGVGLRVLNVQGGREVADRLEWLTRNVGAAAPTDRAARVGLFEAAWVSRAAAVERYRDALAGDDLRVAAHAAMLCGRYRLLELLDEVRALLDDPRPALRGVAVAALKGMDDVAVIPETARLLSDADASVRDAAFTSLRHVAHMPMARRREVMEAVAAELRLGMPWLAAERRAEVAGWLSGSGEAGADLLLALAADPAPGVRLQAARALGMGRERRILAVLANMLGDADEEVAVAAVESLGNEPLRTWLQEDEALLRQVMETLEAVTGQ